MEVTFVMVSVTIIRVSLHVSSLSTAGGFSVLIFIRGYYMHGGGCLHDISSEKVSTWFMK